MKRLDLGTKLANGYRDLWALLMPEMAPPEMATFLLWAGTYETKTVYRAINRAAAKLRSVRTTGRMMTSDDAARYASSVMKNETISPAKGSSTAA